MTVTVWDYGALLASVRVPDRDGDLGEVVVGPTTLDEADDPTDRGGFRGATIGRYSNRIADAAFTLDGNKYELAANDGPNHLHGGAIGFDQYVWRVHSVVADRDNQAAVSFVHHSPDGDEGYPGNLTVWASFHLSRANHLTLDYTAACDAPTIVSLTNHVYWNLAGQGSVRDHRLRIAADRYVHADAARLPVVDPIRAVRGTRYDFTAERRLGDQGFEQGYDDCYVLGQPGVAAELHDPSTGRHMSVSTDQPGVQLYTANHLPIPHTGICLETQALPDSPNQPSFPSPVLRPGQPYHPQTIYHFTAS